MSGIGKEILKKVLTRENLRRIAGNVYFYRGEDYFMVGGVEKIEYYGDAIYAKVIGTRSYNVFLFLNNGELAGECDCPLGEGGEFCKYKVALGLAYLAEGIRQTDVEKSEFDWADFIKTLSRAELENIILEMSPNCSHIVERYRISNIPSKVSLKREILQKIDKLLELAKTLEYSPEYYDDDYYSGRKEYDFERVNIEILLSKIKDDGDFQSLFEIIEFAIEKICTETDYEGFFVSNFLEFLFNCYVRMSYENIQTPEHIALKIFKWQNVDKYGGPEKLYENFEDFPDEVKFLWFDKAIVQWQGFPFVKMGEDCFDSKREKMKLLLLHIAEKREYKDLKLEILQRNLRTPSDIIELSNEYSAQNMKEKILPLLKDAKKAFPYDDTIRLVLVNYYLRNQKSEEALSLVWNDFIENPLDPRIFNVLKTVSEKLNRETEYFEKVLDYLKNYEKERSDKRFVREFRVEILLDAKRYADAWELGKNSNINERLKLRLAKWRAKENPLEPAEICRQLLTNALISTGKEAYKHTISLLKLYQNYMSQAGKTEEFRRYCQQIKNIYKYRRNLITLMEQNKF